MRKIRPGERLAGLPSGTWNRMVDATHVVEGSVPLFGGAEVAGAPAAGVVLARNDSGSACDAGCPVSITQVLEAGRTVRCGLAAFALPAAQPYGILLEPVGAGAIGPVALTGGPWQVLVQGLIAPGTAWSRRRASPTPRRGTAAR